MVTSIIHNSPTQLYQRRTYWWKSSSVSRFLRNLSFDGGSLLLFLRKLSAAIGQSTYAANLVHLGYHAIPYLTIPYFTLPCHTLPHHTRWSQSTYKGCTWDARRLSPSKIKSMNFTETLSLQKCLISFADFYWKPLNQLTEPLWMDQDIDIRT